jgi:hypothetical protein
MSRPRGSNTRAPDPTLREIVERSAEVRARWTRDLEEDRRMQTVAPIVAVPIDGELLGLLPDWRDSPV